MLPTGPDWRLVLTQLHKPKLAVDVAPGIQCGQRGAKRDLGCWCLTLTQPQKPWMSLAWFQQEGDGGADGAGGTQAAGIS